MVNGRLPSTVEASSGARGMTCAGVAQTMLRVNLLSPTGWVGVDVLSAVGATVAWAGILQGC